MFGSGASSSSSASVSPGVAARPIGFAVDLHRGVLKLGRMRALLRRLWGKLGGSHPDDEIGGEGAVGAAEGHLSAFVVEWKEEPTGRRAPSPPRSGERPPARRGDRNESVASTQRLRECHQRVEYLTQRVTELEGALRVERERRARLAAELRMQRELSFITSCVMEQVQGSALESGMHERTPPVDDCGARRRTMELERARPPPLQIDCRGRDAADTCVEVATTPGMAFQTTNDPRVDRRHASVYRDDHRADSSTGRTSGQRRIQQMLSELHQLHQIMSKSLFLIEAQALRKAHPTVKAALSQQPHERPATDPSADALADARDQLLQRLRSRLRARSPGAATTMPME